ncbi:hypothetical protein PROFUN_01491 [Planoprotostelium fungivorum]|uniref:Uncharacterized protein n=1 Tax=Planoprotostelium fungivorum TaxID=1890364 RepID=A0A2P6NTC8_9EUKA|nr:hypothetical protein PROFUN_01491 [Planoprotostelium fungivorum]
MLSSTTAYCSEHPSSNGALRMNHFSPDYWNMHDKKLVIQMHGHQPEKPNHLFKCLACASQSKDLQRQTCLGDCFGTVSVSASRRRRDKRASRPVLSLTKPQDKTKMRQTSLVSDRLETVSRFYSFSFPGIPGTNPLQDYAPRVEREESKDIEDCGKGLSHDDQRTRRILCDEVKKTISDVIGFMLIDELYKCLLLNHNQYEQHHKV